MKRLPGLFGIIACSLSLTAQAFADTPVAKVAGRTITMEELKKTLNSTPYGMPAPNAPAPAGKEVMLQMLAALIDAELLHGEAVSLNVPKQKEFKAEAAKFRTSMLADKYRQTVLAKTVPIADETLKSHAKEKSVPLEAARAILQNENRKKLLAEEGARLFDLYKVQYSPAIAKGNIGTFKNDERLVSSAAFNIDYGDIKAALRTFGNTKNGLLDLLAQMVERELFAARAKEDGMENDPGFAAEIADYEKNLAVAMHRETLNKKYAPAKGEIASFLKQNQHLRYKPRTANVLMIVAKTEKEAAALRKKTLGGANFYELAISGSIAPDAKIAAGRVNPMIIGNRPHTPIDKAILALKPGEITKPIRGDKGYSIFKLMDISPRENRSAAEMKEQAAKQIVEIKMAAHLEGLRQSNKVELLPAIKGMGENG